jgi:hypothetical protein
MLVQNDGVLTTTHPVPARLWEISASRRGAQQPGVNWNQRAWQTSLPGHSELFARLPNPISRASVAIEASVLTAESDAARVFVAAMVWGYGRVGYGPFRTARVLAENLDAPSKLLEAANRVRGEGGPQAFAWLAKNRLNWLGVAFATKYLFYCSGPGATPALVLDRLVQGWLRQHADWSVRLDWHVGDYQRYVHTVVDWATELDVAPSEVEYLMFSDAARDAGSQWAEGYVNGELPLPSTQAEPSVRTEDRAVLEALEEAVELFAALPYGLGRDDVGDSERGLRQLRRIVLARPVPPSVP